MWNGFNEIWAGQDVAGPLASTVLWLVILSFLRVFLIRTIRQSKKIPIEVRRRWVVLVKNLAIILFVVGLVVIWAAELRSFAVSLVAVAAALAIVTKEVILCFMGGVYRTSTRAFDIGDRIEVQGLRGDVIDFDLFRTSLYEIGPGHSTNQYTGKMIVVPNSLLLSQSLIVERRSKYLLHDIRIPTDLKEKDWKLEKANLLTAANEVCAAFVEEAQAYMNKLGDIEGIEAPNAHPRVTVHFVDPDRIDLLVRFPVPGYRKMRTEQDIIERFLALKTPMQALPPEASLQS